VTLAFYSYPIESFELLACKDFTLFGFPIFNYGGIYNYCMRNIKNTINNKKKAKNKTKQNKKKQQQYRYVFNEVWSMLF
jgi:hypothetical protein